METAWVYLVVLYLNGSTCSHTRKKVKQRYNTQNCQEERRHEKKDTMATRIEYPITLLITPGSGAPIMVLYEKHPSENLPEEMLEYFERVRVEGDGGTLNDLDRFMAMVKKESTIDPADESTNSLQMVSLLKDYTQLLEGRGKQAKQDIKIPVIERNSILVDGISLDDSQEDMLSIIGHLFDIQASEIASIRRTLINGFAERVFRSIVNSEMLNKKSDHTSRLNNVILGILYSIDVAPSDERLLRKQQLFEEYEEEIGRDFKLIPIQFRLDEFVDESADSGVGIGRTINVWDFLLTSKALVSEEHRGILMKSSKPMLSVNSQHDNSLNGKAGETEPLEPSQTPEPLKTSMSSINDEKHQLQRSNSIVEDKLEGFKKLVESEVLNRAREKSGSSEVLLNRLNNLENKLTNLINDRTATFILKDNIIILHCLVHLVSERPEGKGDSCARMLMHRLNETKDEITGESLSLSHLIDRLLLLGILEGLPMQWSEDYPFSLLVTFHKLEKIIERKRYPNLPHERNITERSMHKLWKGTRGHRNVIYKSKSILFWVDTMMRKGVSQCQHRFMAIIEKQMTPVLHTLSIPMLEVFDRTILKNCINCLRNVLELIINKIANFPTDLIISISPSLCFFEPREVSYYIAQRLLYMELILQAIDE